jgi:dGTP triphosphohydrolase
MHQRLQTIIDSTRRYQRTHHHKSNWKASKLSIKKSIRRFLKQQNLFTESLTKTAYLCDEIADDRSNHILAIETSRNKKIFDCMSEYQTHVLETQGREEYEEYIKEVKCEVFGIEGPMDEQLKGIPRYMHLLTVKPKWEDIGNEFYQEDVLNISNQMVQHWYSKAIKAKQLLKDMSVTLRHI